MSFFKRLFQKSAPVAVQEPEPATPVKESIILLFEALPDLIRGMVQMRQFFRGLEVQLDRMDGVEQGTYHFGEHQIRVQGLPAALPREVQQRTIHFSNWPQSVKDGLYHHRAHLICTYEGHSEDPRAQLLALYQLATAFSSLGLLAVVDEAAHNVTPVHVLQEVFTGLQVSDLQQDFPVLLWTNLLKFHRPDGSIWYATRGFERFDAPNFAMLGQPGEGNRIFDLLGALLRYVVYHKAALAAGHTAELGAHLLHFAEPYEYRDHLTGKGELLVAEVLSGP
ncbi:hypothetical protein [Deinococcus roseus]|uniref:DUF4261 domain-containing protein n=1 Tax=Deinococcus roseus TaxID=392414 RepID=A0ABQ2CVX0_9DEIO|nr:hypothetical protein [Deinococcus roseus]GGJ25805.1 hypothetical protein GCM10008938_09900 [Deinococcus roseus]